MTSSHSDCQYAFSWKIKDFTWCVKKYRKFLLSPVFYAPSLGNSKWKINICLENSEYGCENFLSVYLVNVDLNVRKIIIEFKFEITGMDPKGVLKSVEYISPFEKGERKGWGGFLNTKRLDENRESSLSETYTIVCYMKKMGQQSGPTFEHEACTENHVDKFSVFFNVRNPNSPEWAESKKVHIPEGSLFHINLTCPNNDIIIHISRLSNPQQLSKIVRIKISLLDNKGIERRSATDSHFFDSNENVWKFPLVISKSLLRKNILLNGTFSLFCEMYISHGKVSEMSSGIVQYVSPNTNHSYYSDSISTLQDDVRNLFYDEKHSDVKIKSGKTVFYAHKLILAARSSVFSAMFEHEMIENQEGVVNIEDLDSNTLKNLLEFIYTDSFDEIDYESTLNLLIAADKYEVVPLIERCSDYLIRFMSVDNVCDTLVLADMISYNHLKSYAIDYIAENSNEIRNSSNWLLWMESNEKLQVQILRSIENHKNERISKLKLCISKLELCLSIKQYIYNSIIRNIESIFNL